MTTKSPMAALDTTALVAAIEQRDATALAALYAADATITIVDRDHPPAAPVVVSGQDEIGAYYRDICGRNIDHTAPMVVADAAGVAFQQHCRYPEGNAVVCVSVASVEAGLIRSQSIAQSWD